MRECRGCGWRWTSTRSMYCAICRAAMRRKPIVPLTFATIRVSAEPIDESTLRAIADRDRRVAAWEREQALKVPSLVCDDGVLFQVAWDGSL